MHSSFYTLPGNQVSAMAPNSIVVIEFVPRDVKRQPKREDFPELSVFVASSADEVLGQPEVVAPAIFARSDESAFIS